jgi:hypothetical protein
MHQAVAYCVAINPHTHAPNTPQAKYDLFRRRQAPIETAENNMKLGFYAGWCVPLAGAQKSSTVVLLGNCPLFQNLFGLQELFYEDVV